MKEQYEDVRDASGEIIGVREIAARQGGNTSEENGAGDLTDEQIIEIARKAFSTGEISWAGFSQDERGQYMIPVVSPMEFGLCRAVARAAIASYLARQPKAEHARGIFHQPMLEAIQGAIAFGRMGVNPPPSSEHWGNEFWQIGRQLAKLGETSAWDNVTPVDAHLARQAQKGDDK